MNSEMLEMWDALKESKYRRTMEELSAVLNERRNSFSAAMQGVLNIVSTAMHAEAGTLWQLSRVDGLIRAQATYNGSDLSGIYLLPGEGIAGQVIKETTPVMISDCQKDQRWAGKVDKDTGFCTRSMLCVPLCGTDGTAFGCIQLINKTDGSLFDERDLQFAVKLANVVAQRCEERAATAGIGAAADKREQLFYEIFFADALDDMEERIRKIAEFSSLGVKDQNEILEHAGAIWKVFHQKRKRTEKRKIGIFGG